MTLQDSDKFLVNRSTNSFHVEAQNLMAELKDDDLMLVNRDGQSYKATGLEIKDSLNPAKPPEITNVQLTEQTPETPERFTNQKFDFVVACRPTGTVPMKFKAKAKVEGNLNKQLKTDEIVGVESQVWSATSTLSTGGIPGNAQYAFNGELGGGEAIFGGKDGKRTATEAPFTINSSLRLYQNNGLNIPTTITFNDSQEITVTKPDGFADGSFKWYDVDLSSLSLPFSVTKMELFYETDSSNNAINAIEVDGKILLDPVNESKKWSDDVVGAPLQGNEALFGAANAFNGITEGDFNREGMIPDGDALWTTTDFPDATSVTLYLATASASAGWLKVNGNDVSVDLNSRATITVTVPLSGGLQRVEWKGDSASNYINMQAIAPDGLLLVDPGMGKGIAGALGNTLKRTWLEWNNVVTLFIDNPEDVETFNAIKASLDDYCDDVQACRERLFEELRASTIPADDVEEIINYMTV